MLVLLHQFLLLFLPFSLYPHLPPTFHCTTASSSPSNQRSLFSGFRSQDHGSPSSGGGSGGGGVTLVSKKPLPNDFSSHGAGDSGGIALLSSRSLDTGYGGRFDHSRGRWFYSSLFGLCGIKLRDVGNVNEMLCLIILVHFEAWKA